MLRQSMFKATREAERNGILFNHRGYMTMFDDSYENVYNDYGYYDENAVSEGGEFLAKNLERITEGTGKKVYKDLNGGIIDRSLTGSKKNAIDDTDQLIRGHKAHFTRPDGMTDEEFEAAKKAASELKDDLRFENIMKMDGADKIIEKAGFTTKEELLASLKSGKIKDEVVNEFVNVISKELSKQGKYEHAYKLRHLNIQTKRTVIGMILEGVIIGAAMTVVMGGFNYVMDMRREKREYKMLYGR
jgi:hypothetical protein